MNALGSANVRALFFSCNSSRRRAPTKRPHITGATGYLNDFANAKMVPSCSSAAVMKMKLAPRRAHDAASSNSRGHRRLLRLNNSGIRQRLGAHQPGTDLALLASVMANVLIEEDFFTTRFPWRKHVRLRGGS